MSFFLYLRPYNQHNKNLLWVGISGADNLASRDYSYAQFEHDESSFIFLAKFSCELDARLVEANLKVYLRSIKMHSKKDLYFEKSYTFILAYLNAPSFQFKFESYFFPETKLFLGESQVIRAQKASDYYHKKKLLVQSNPVLLADKKQRQKETDARYYIRQKVLLASDPVLLAHKKQRQREAYAKYRAKKKAENEKPPL